LSGTAKGPRQPPVQWTWIYFSRLKQPGCDINHPPPSSAEAKERIELYLDFIYAPSWTVLGRTLPFPIIEKL